ncbi:MAG: hypothetical protein AB7F31_00755 [Parachlamydiales bacterium]
MTIQAINTEAQGPLTAGQVEQIKLMLQAFGADKIESGGALAAPADARVNYIENPLGANAPVNTGALPEGAGTQIFTLWDVIKALGPQEMATALLNQTSVGIIQAQSTRIGQLGLQLRSFENAKKIIQKQIDQEKKTAKRWGIFQKVMMDTLSLAAGFAMGGPVGLGAAAATIAINTTLQETGAYAKMTKGMSPGEAFATQLGVSIGIGLATGLATAGGMAVSNGMQASGKAVAQNLATSGEKMAAQKLVQTTVKEVVEETTEQTGKGTVKAVEETVAAEVKKEIKEGVVEAVQEVAEKTVQKGGQVAKPTDSTSSTGSIGVGAVTKESEALTIREVSEESSNIAKEALKEGEQVAAKSVKKQLEEAASGVLKPKYTQQGLRAFWMGLGSTETVANDFISSGKDGKSGQGLWGNLYLAFGGGEKGATAFAAGMGIGLQIVQFAASAKLMPGSILTDSEGAGATFMKRLQQATTVLQSATGTASGTFGAVQGFTQYGQYKQMANLGEKTTNIETEAQQARFLQGVFLSEAQSAARTNQNMMSTVFGVIQSLSQIMGNVVRSHGA